MRGASKSHRLIIRSEVDLLHPSSLQMLQLSISTLLFFALVFTVSQTSVFPPSSWQPRNVITSFFSRIFISFYAKSHFERTKHLPFFATIFWQTISTLTSAFSKKSILVISFNQSPTFSPMETGLQVYKWENVESLVDNFKVSKIFHATSIFPQPASF